MFFPIDSTDAKNSRLSQSFSKLVDVYFLALPNCSRKMEMVLMAKMSLTHWCVHWRDACPILMANWWLQQKRGCTASFAILQGTSWWEWPTRWTKSCPMIGRCLIAFLHPCYNQQAQQNGFLCFSKKSKYSVQVVWPTGISSLSGRSKKGLWRGRLISIQILAASFDWHSLEMREQKILSWI